MDIVKKAIPLFPPGLLQGGSDGVKSLLSRYETLVQTKQQFLQRDFSKEVFFFFLFFFFFHLIVQIETRTKTTITKIICST